MNLSKLASIVFISIALFMASETNAQGIRLGIKAGANMDQTSGNDLMNEFNGFVFGGLYAGAQFTKFRVQAELLFSQSTITTGDGFKNAYANFINQGAQDVKNGTFKMNELSIPLIVGVNIIPKFLWLEAGPQYTAVVSIKDKNDFLKETESVIKNGYVSGLVGASLELPLNLNAGVRYVFGLSNRNNTEVKEKWRTSHFQIAVGYSFMR